MPQLIAKISQTYVAQIFLWNMAAESMFSWLLGTLGPVEQDKFIKKGPSQTSKCMLTLVKVTIKLIELN